jgi:two-component system sensor histidine kinase TctE
LIARSSLPFGRLSLRSQLLLGILLPVLALIGLNTASLYGQALRNANLAYDRTLLASAKVIGEQLEVDAAAAPPRLRATVPYSALEAFEADARSRMVYKVSGFDGETVSGYEDLPRWSGRIPPRPAYAALVDFYDDHYHGEPVRVAVLLQPVAGGQGGGMATIQVAETLELRQALARQILIDTLWRQALLVLVISAVVLWVVQRATRPVRELSQRMLQRGEHDLAPIATRDAPRELLPLVSATNQVMARLAHLLADQKRFVRDTAHQLRTPLAVLRTQLQSAQRGDVAPAQALQEMQGTVERATVLANQMLSLAKVEQLRQQGGAPVLDWAEITRAVALDLAPLIAQAGQDFEIDTAPAPVRAHEWALRELTRNLLHNALKYNRPQGRLAVRLDIRDGAARLHIADDGPGIAPELRQRLFQPFAAGDPRSGSGLGLAICQEIVASLGGDIRLDNRLQGGQVAGLDAVVSLPLADNPA